MSKTPSPRKPISPHPKASSPKEFELVEDESHDPLLLLVPASPSGVKKAKGKFAVLLLLVVLSVVFVLFDSEKIQAQGFVRGIMERDLEQRQQQQPQQSQPRKSPWWRKLWPKTFVSSCTTMETPAAIRNKIQTISFPSIHPNGSWHDEKTSDTSGWEHWTWRQPKNASGGGTVASYTSSRKKANQEEEKEASRTFGTVSKLLQNSTLVFYGSSHLRELYQSLVRIELGATSWDATLSKNVTFLPSGYKHRTKACDPTQSGFRDGLFGVDMVACGTPGRRIVSELQLPANTNHNHVAIGFKTFLHTPDADAQFLDFLQKQDDVNHIKTDNNPLKGNSVSSNSLRHPDILVVDIGVWGPRGNKMGGSVKSVWTHAEEADYYTRWLLTSFPYSHIVVVQDITGLNSNIWPQVLTILQQEPSPLPEQQQQVSILAKDILQDAKKRPQGMACAHGCAGPVVHTMALLFVEWLQQRQSALQEAKTIINCRS